MKKTMLVAGASSDIYNGIKPLLSRDYDIAEYPSFRKWDVLLVPIGRVAPVGNWWQLDAKECIACANSNIIAPLTCLGSVWNFRNPDARVVFFAGSNPQKIMAGYLPYNVAKMALIKAVEQLDSETTEAVFVAFGPGYYANSKIHRPTLEKGWPNERIAKGDAGHSIEQIWSALKWILEQDKATVGGRNVAVSDYLKRGAALGAWLREDANRLKLRRYE